VIGRFVLVSVGVDEALFGALTRIGLTLIA
jgi:hypothetical protein